MMMLQEIQSTSLVVGELEVLSKVVLLKRLMPEIMETFYKLVRKAMNIPQYAKHT